MQTSSCRIASSTARRASARCPPKSCLASCRCTRAFFRASKAARGANFGMILRHGCRLGCWHCCSCRSWRGCWLGSGMSHRHQCQGQHQTQCAKKRCEFLHREFLLAYRLMREPLRICIPPARATSLNTTRIERLCAAWLTIPTRKFYRSESSRGAATQAVVPCPVLGSIQRSWFGFDAHFTVLHGLFIGAFLS
jgi:hypothetical protein